MTGRVRRLLESVQCRRLTRRVAVAFAGSVCAILVCQAPLASHGRLRLAKAYSIPVPSESQVVLEDVSPGGLALLNSTGGFLVGYGGANSWNTQHPKLLLYDTAARRIGREVPLDAWVKELSASEAFRAGPFRFTNSGGDIVGVLGRWLVAMSAQSRDVFYKRPLSPNLPELRPSAARAWAPVRATIAANPSGQSVAVASGAGTRDRIDIYGADLKTQLTGWGVERDVQSMSWSPDGKTLAVLYSGVLGKDGKYVEWWPKNAVMDAQPNVQILDAQTGRKVVGFNSGYAESKIEFSHDGRAVYAITEGRCGECESENRDLIQVFSALDGHPLETFHVPRTGVRSTFQLSPDGRLLVANASSAWKLLGIMGEAGWTKANGRFVVMDAQTGQVLFRRRERTWNSGAPFVFAFSPDGRLLFVDNNCNNVCPGGERVDVYSVEGSP